MESHSMTSPEDARRALEGVDGSRRSIADRVAAPWWYRWGVATCTAGLFVGAAFTTAPSDEPSTLGALMTVALPILGSFALLAALKRATGVSVDRYASGMGTWFAVVFALFGVALAIQVVAEVAFVLPVAAVAALVATLVLEQRINTRLRERALVGAAAG